MSKYIINGRFLTQKITGVQRYAWELCRELDKIIKPGELIMAVPPEVTKLPDLKNISLVKVGHLHGRMWEQISFPWYVYNQNAISINFCNVAPLFSPGIVFIYDMKIKAHPEFFNWKFKLWYEILFYNSMHRAKIIFTDSKFAKNEILKYYPYVDNRNIYVLYAGWQHMDRVEFDNDALVKYGLIKNNYYFALGSLDPNKNFKWIAEQAKNNPNEVYAVSGAINKIVFARGLGFECPSNMKLLGYVSDAEAKTLMRDCKAFLFPSIYEGFGIPPLEAMSCGAQNIIVSNIEVMHEVFGESVNYMGNTCELANQSVNNGIISSVCKKYNWHDSAKFLVSVIKNI